jgi:hypothetical protein
MAPAEKRKGSVGFTEENGKFLGVLPPNSRDYLGPLFLIALCSPFAILLWHTIWYDIGLG